MTSSALRYRGQRLVLAAVLTLGSLAAVLPAHPAKAAGPPAKPAGPGKIAPELVERMQNAGNLRSGGRLEAVVVLGARPEVAPDSTGPAEVREDLAESAAASQAPVVSLVKSQGDEVVNTFWLKNMVLVRAKPATLRQIASLAPVERVIPNFELKAPEGKPEAASAKALRAAASTWGVTKIGADRVRSERGLTGDGVRVAVLDTGVDISHPDLAGKLVTADAADPAYPGGWIEFGPDGRPVPSTPHDSAYHGTHVAGTIAGGDASGTQIGVAPGADLMAGLVIPGGRGSLAQVIAGMEWAVAPYDAQGRPAGKPANVVSMSLGGDGYSDEMVEPARNIYRAGAFPAFAIGNDCAPGGSASPGNIYEAVAVGATDGNDDVADFSCGGVVNRDDWVSAPAEWPDSYIVPDVSAPGVDVLSAMPDGEYAMLSGTSMATPHVSGTIALMMQARPGLGVDEALDILEGTSFSDTRYGALPNDRFGAGRIDAYAAVAEAALDSGVRGTVTDGKTRKPLAGVAVTRAGGRTVTTDAQGRFEMRVAAGSYDLTLTRFGYRSSTLRVQVKAHRFAEPSVALDQTRRGGITGKVVYGPTGITVAGSTVTVLAVPDRLAATTDVNGKYTITDVPEGDYQVAAVAPGLSRSEPLAVGVHQGRSSSGRADITLPRAPATERVSLGAEGRQGDTDSWWPRLSADGSAVAFASAASTLVPDDTNNDLDAFVTDLHTGATERVSVASDGTQSDAFSLTPTLNADGRYAGFSSGATNLVPGDTNGQTDAFVRDRRSGTTELVSVATDGTLADGLSSAPSFSADGRFAVFNSDATNLVPGDTNGGTDVFVRDRQARTTERVSLGRGGAQASGSSREQSISADGRYVAFESGAADLVDGDTNERSDLFVRDRQAGTTELIPAPEGIDPFSPQISGDGRSVVFIGSGRTGWQIYLYDRQSRATTLVSAAPDGAAGDDWSFAPSVSGDGRTVVFYSTAKNLVTPATSGHYDVYVRDLAAGTTERISTDPRGGDGDGSSELPSVSGDGRFVAFQSTSANLTLGDTNRHSDIFVRDRRPGPEPRFALTGLEIAPKGPRSGKPVRISAWVKNVGEKAGGYDAVLLVGDDAEVRRTVQVRPGKAEQVCFEVRAGAAGDYTVKLGPLTGTFTVRRR
ncbi:hypothetical protein Sme01_73370 [Sphaerisporangium melleum]|uniref:Peptidase S8/S53 domain-containing protein n=1 Tax=Sphaerisporangium melleum TaxID=321316 RepID=A0A917VW83_9ACTN|nr:S8 family serine peptidase [Sphaerisporangium melleum]GGL20320.1 hypothetical protein GCM10007964_72830 [Sphaerisporangium melleum]GII74861.1 hypothetical protein Sme01_73370 [Sphaerisporangium melleum]